MMPATERPSPEREAAELVIGWTAALGIRIDVLELEKRIAEALHARERATWQAAALRCEQAMPEYVAGGDGDETIWRRNQSRALAATLRNEGTV